MKFKIGDIVKYSESKNLTDLFIVLATKETPLTKEELNSNKNPNLHKVDNIKKIAENNLSVNNEGFDYVIYQINNKNKDFIRVFETDID